MPKTIEGAPYNFCLPHCKHMNISVDTNYLFAAEGKYAAEIIMRCEHEAVCKAWAERAYHANFDFKY